MTKVILVGGASALASIPEVLAELDAQGIEYELQEPHEMLLHAVDREPPPIISPLEIDRKPYPERNRKKGKQRKY